MVIRVGVIGLSAKAKTSWASSAHLPYLQASGGKYVIIALCNSSVSAAESAIEAYNLPASTKAYGSYFSELILPRGYCDCVVRHVLEARGHIYPQDLSCGSRSDLEKVMLTSESVKGNPQDLAEDPEVDLVVCTTRVDLHYETIKPSLLKGKDVYCEWPLASNMELAEELHSMAKENNARTIVGLQGELSPMLLKVKSLIEQDNKIGKVLSSSVIAAGGTKTRDGIAEGLKYFTQKAIGGNMVTIGFGHMIDFVMLVLGELSNIKTQLSVQRPQVPIIGSKGTVETVTTDVADHIMLQGTLSQGTPSFGAPLSVTFRRGPPFKGTPGFEWLIHGEKGEIRITAAGPALQVNDDGTNITVYTFDQEEIEVIEWDRTFKDLPQPARNVAAIYEAFALRDTKKLLDGAYPDFGRAVWLHKQIEEVCKGAE